MNLNTLNEFRHATYGCFKQAQDALFNTMDALRSEPEAHRFPELSLSPLFQRKWASLYEAFEDGKIDADRLREVLVQFAPLPGAGEHVFLGVDTSNLYRPDAHTSADRTLVRDLLITSWAKMGSDLWLTPCQPARPLPTLVLSKSARLGEGRVISQGLV
ncbi:MAG TPA: hypothetical protein VFV38_12850 [Ktedonobacteraceae bacterium]|nr:hypothetical protein [Ktedonobacteraceae bacterium]